MKSPHQNSVYILGHPSLYVTHRNPVGYITLTSKGRMLDISNAACTLQWPNVRYI